MENRARNVFLLLALVAFAHSETTVTPTSPSTVTDAAAAAAAAAASSTSSSASPTVSTPTVTDIPAPAQPVKEANNGSEPNVEIDVYYEALCKDSINFVKDQLAPTYAKLNKYMTITFIPFAQGQVTKNASGEMSIKCKRDKPECDADILHACGVTKIVNKDQKVNFVKCLLVKASEDSKILPFDSCAQESKIDDETKALISSCISGNNSYTLLENYAKLSQEAHVVNVPKIFINKKYSEEEQKLATTKFQKAVCDVIVKTKPDAQECMNNTNGSNTLVVGVLPIIVGVFYFIKMF